MCENLESNMYTRNCCTRIKLKISTIKAIEYGQIEADLIKTYNILAYALHRYTQFSNDLRYDVNSHRRQTSALTLLRLYRSSFTI